MVDLNQETLDELIEAGVIDKETARRIRKYFHEQGDRTASGFKLSHTAYYLGALIVLAALAWFTSQAWIQYGGAVMAGVVAAYGVGFWQFGDHLWQQEEFRVAGGLLVVLAAWTVPLTLFGLQHELGLWAGWEGNSPGDITRYGELLQFNWFTMEFGLLMASTLFLRRYSFPFLVFPLVAAGWFFGMDLVELIAQTLGGQVPFEEHRITTLVYGLLVLGAGFYWDQRTRENYSFWLYLFGLLLAWTAFSAGGIDRVIYLLANLGLMGGAILLRRRTIMVFGSLGVFSYLTWLTSELFEESMLFPIALITVGVAIIWLGLQYRKHRQALQRWMQRQVPASLRRQLPHHRSRTEGD